MRTDKKKNGLLLVALVELQRLQRGHVTANTQGIINLIKKELSS